MKTTITIPPKTTRYVYPEHVIEKLFNDIKESDNRLLLTTSPDPPVPFPQYQRASLMDGIGVVHSDTAKLKNGVITVKALVFDHYKELARCTFVPRMIGGQIRINEDGNDVLPDDVKIICFDIYTFKNNETNL